LQPSDLVLDIGCGARPFAKLLSQLRCDQVGIDRLDGFYGQEAIDVAGAADAVPVVDGAADAVLSSQVIEHLPEPESALHELNRVLKTGGFLFISFPFLYPLHVAPFDFFRYSRHGFEAMCGRHGFEIIEEHRQGGFWDLASVYCGVYFGSLERSVSRGVPFLTILSLPLHWIFWILHKFEGGIYRIFGKEADGQRRSWTVNLVFVVRKTG